MDSWKGKTAKKCLRYFIIREDGRMKVAKEKAMEESGYEWTADEITEGNKRKKLLCLW